ncbi:MAG: glycosyltransferase family 2 protein [Gemmatimonadaceae bacterium]
MTRVPSLLLEYVLALAALPALAAASYLCLLAVAARGRAVCPAGRRYRFDVIVPAHDEEHGIASTIESLSRLDYPHDHYRVIVVADNCTDATVARATAAGARVLVRNDPRRGKGFALAYGYDASARDGFAEAVVVVDADSEVSANLLDAFAARLDDGEEAMQAEYGVRNRDASPRTRLMAVALALFHTLRSRARETWGLSCGLRGNGMCFRSSLLQRVPATAFSIVEDVEFGFALGFAGIPVAYVGDAYVLGDMPTSGDASRSQRRRWEEGRALLIRRYLVPLLREAVVRRDRLLLDLALDLAVPPLSRLIGVTTVGIIVAAGFYVYHATDALPLVLWSVTSAGLVVYVARGVAIAGGGWQTIRALAWAPVYALWKLTLIRRASASEGAWVRTSRLHDKLPVE